MDGIEVLKKVKTPNPDAEVIMITGHGDNDLAIKSLKYESIDFIKKPVGNDSLEIALKRAEEKIYTRRQLKKYTENLEKLLQEKIELQNHLSSLGAMIESISYGIKGLLTRLDGAAYIISSACKNQNLKDVGDVLDMLDETTERIKKMVLDILYYSKKREINLKTTDLKKFTDDLTRIINQKIQGKNKNFNYDFDKAPVENCIDEDLLHSALINILDNAVDACLYNGSRESHSIDFKLFQNRSAVIFKICDNGVGMDNEVKKHVFELYFSSKGFINDIFIPQFPQGLKGQPWEG